MKNRRWLVLALLVVPFLGTQADDAKPERPGSALNALDSGADPTGRKDSTDAIQKLLDGLCDPSATGVLELPVGDYKITRTLVYRGSYGYGLRIRGACGAAGPSGTILRWAGPEGGTVLELRGASDTSVEHLAIDGNGRAKVGLALGYDHERSVGTTFVTLSHLVIGGVAGPGSAALAIGIKPDGTADTFQADAITINKCKLVGHGQKQESAYGIRTGVANAKNFAIRDCGVIGFKTGIKHGGSGFLIVDGFAGGNNGTDFEGHTSHFEVRAGNSEGSGMLFDGSTGANPGSLSISNFSWSSAKANPVILRHQGYIELVGCHFQSNSGPNAWPSIHLNDVPGTPAALVSRGNWYQNVRGQIPVVDGAGNLIVGSPRVSSFGDYGGTPGNLLPLTPLPAPPPSPDTLQAKDLVLSGSIDFGDGRRWDGTGIYLRKDQRWTADGFFPGDGLAIKWPGAGGLLGYPDESLRFVGWSVDAQGDRRSGIVVPPLRGGR